MIVAFLACRTQAATASPAHGASVKANERVVEAFLQDVVNEHNGDHAINYLNPDMQWYGGTVIGHLVASAASCAAPERGDLCGGPHGWRG